MSGDVRVVNVEREARESECSLLCSYEVLVQGALCRIECLRVLGKPE